MTDFVKNVQTDDYKTVAEYIMYLCKQKGTTFAQVCRELGFNYSSLNASFRTHYIKHAKLTKLINYLDGDFNIVMNLPVNLK